MQRDPGQHVFSREDQGPPVLDGEYLGSVEVAGELSWTELGPQTDPSELSDRNAKAEAIALIRFLAFSGIVMLGVALDMSGALPVFVIPEWLRLAFFGMNIGCACTLFSCWHRNLVGRDELSDTGQWWHSVWTHEN